MRKFTSLTALILCMSFPAQSAIAGDVSPPPTGVMFDYQLGGAYPPPEGVGIVVRDRTDAPEPGLYSICYINTFQTQASEAEFWQARPELVLHRADGSLFEDENWPGEYLLDTRTPEQRQALAEIFSSWIDGCADAGFQAIDPDNLDTWTRSDGLLTQDGNLAMAKLLADMAHARGLAISQKNAVEISAIGKSEIGFDYAVAESCQVWDECDGYTEVYGANVLSVEYTDTDASNFNDSCAARGDLVPVLHRDRDLTTPGSPGYFFAAC